MGNQAVLAFLVKMKVGGNKPFHGLEKKEISEFYLANETRAYLKEHSTKTT